MTLPYDAIVFDLDGTLVDTAPDLHRSLNHVLADAGLQPVALDDVRHMVGHGARRLVELGFAANGTTGERDLEAGVQTFLAYYADHLADTSVPFPGAVDCLERLTAAGAVLGVCTNKAERYSTALLDALGLSRFFAAVVGGDSLPVRKPDGGHLTGTLDAMGAGGRRAVMIGDTTTDVAAARNAGVPVAAVSFGYTAGPAADLGADGVIDHFDGLETVLAAMAATSKPANA